MKKRGKLNGLNRLNLNIKKLKHRIKQQKVMHRHLKKRSKISLMLDDYNDIFSSFDPRGYEHRSLSVDFLSEAKRASRDKSTGEFELSILIPKKKRNPNTEAIIKRRVQEHFHRHFLDVRQEKFKIINQGLLFIFFGIVTMFIATILLFKHPEKVFYKSFLIILLEPGGWFLFWEGLDLVLFEPKTLNPDLEFYHKMSQCELYFESY